MQPSLSLHVINRLFLIVMQKDYVAKTKGNEQHLIALPSSIFRTVGAINLQVLYECKTSILQSFICTAQTITVYASELHNCSYVVASFLHLFLRCRKTQYLELAVFHLKCSVHSTTLSLCAFKYLQRTETGIVPQY